MPSLMPPGLAAQLESRQEFLDLARFVSLLGRPGDYAPSTDPVIRVWRLAGSDGVDLPAYSKVDGSLPLEEIGEARPNLRTEVSVLVSGPVTLDLNDATGLRLEIDGNKIEDLTGKIHLEEGTRTLTFEIDKKVRGTTPLRAELVTPRGAPTRFQLQTGI